MYNCADNCYEIIPYIKKLSESICVDIFNEEEINLNKIKAFSKLTPEFKINERFLLENPKKMDVKRRLTIFIQQTIKFEGFISEYLKNPEKSVLRKKRNIIAISI